MRIGPSLGVVRLPGLPRIPLIRRGWISPRLSFARAQLTGVEASHIGADNSTLVFDAADAPRFRGSAQRLTIEGQRTNALSATEALSTQSVIVTATAYTLSFWGTGSVTLSGAATGTLSGTGAANRVTQTFTPSAGTLTLTVSGSVQYAQLEQGAFASTYIRKATGAATRGADLPAASLASLGIPASGACTVLWSGVIPQFAATSGATQSIIQLDDGTGTNRFMLRNPSPTSVVTVNRVTAGSVAGDATVGTPSAGVAFAAGLTIDGAGRLAASFNGAAVGVRIGGPTSGLTTLRVGADSSGASALFGDGGYLDVIPRAVDDATLQRLVAAMPT